MPAVGMAAVLVLGYIGPDAVMLPPSAARPASSDDITQAGPRSAPTTAAAGPPPRRADPATPACRPRINLSLTSEFWKENVKLRYGLIWP